MTDRRLQDFDIGSVSARQVSSADLDELCEMHSDPTVMTWLGGVRDRTESERYLEQNAAHWRRHGFGIYILRDRPTERLIGRAGLRWVKIEDVDEVEVAYALRPEVWGQGLATAMCRELVARAAAARLTAELIAFTVPTNLRSRRVMTKAGFAYQRAFEHSGVPHVLYRQRISR